MGRLSYWSTISRLSVLGHITVCEVTAGIADRCIDDWEPSHSASTPKNTVRLYTRRISHDLQAVCLA